MTNVQCQKCTSEIPKRMCGNGDWGMGGVFVPGLSVTVRRTRLGWKERWQGGREGQRQIRLSACCLPLPLLKPESRFATATATCKTRVLVCHYFLQRLISTVHWYNFCKFMRDKILWQLVHLNFNCKLKFEIALTFFRIEGLISKFFLDFCTERNMTKVWWGRG